MLQPRSYLFVPGDRPDRFAKAVASGAEAVIVDLEDAVAAAAKADARAQVAAWLSQPPPADGPLRCVRVNAADSAEFADDLTLGRLPGLQAIVLPKAERVDDLARLAAAAPQRALLPIVESAAGFAAAAALARAPQVRCLVFGSIDFALDLGIAPGGPSADERELDLFRSQLVLVSRLAGIAAPVDGVVTRLDDPQRLHASAARARQFGFGGKLCVHPAQVAAVHAAFRPAAAELAWARRVCAAAAAGGAVQVDGEMIDRPLLLRAQAIVRAAG